MSNTSLIDIAMRLGARGFSPMDISEITGLPLTEVLTLPFQREVKEAEPEDIGIAMSHVAWRVYEEAMKILDSGNPTQKMALMRLVMSFTMRSMVNQPPHGQEELRAAFQELIRSNQLSHTDPEDEDLIDSAWVEEDEPNPLDGATDDPDEGFDN